MKKLTEVIILKGHLQIVKDYLVGQIDIPQITYDHLNMALERVDELKREREEENERSLR